MRSASRCYYVLLSYIVNYIPINNATPHVLSTCRTAYNEGREMFYSKNTFVIPHGPLLNSKVCFDRLQPQDKRLIRHLVLDLNILDLSIEAFDDIEGQLRAKDVAQGKLPRDDSIEDWVAPVVYNITSTWRSKLAWLQDWSWLEDLEIYSFLRIGFHDIPYIRDFKLQGHCLKEFLKGIGPMEPHCPVMDCYKDCNSMFAKQMRLQESFIWTLVTIMIGAFGWKGTKAIIRSKALEEEDKQNRAMAAINVIG
ncbi:MAG: hypothetical protein Q9209_006374 [Squamulea sp. 1 TL-2023]